MIWMLILFFQTSAAADYARSAGRETGVTLSAICLPAGEPA